MRVSVHHRLATHLTSIKPIKLCRFIFDLQMPSQSSPDYVKLRPHDEEVESFSVGLLLALRLHP